MVNVSAAMVKQLRDATGAGFLDCKKALVENDADFEASQDWLRQKGILKVASKSSRAASEGLVAVGSSAGGAAMSVVEINSETDFVSRNEDFQGLVRDVADVSCVVDDGNKDTLSSTLMTNGKTVQNAISDMAAMIGENIVLRRFCRVLALDGQVVLHYVHGQVSECVGRIAVLAVFVYEGISDIDAIREFGKKICMHIAASRPLALSEEELDQEIVKKERIVLTEQAKDSGKPQEVIDKMVLGRLRKFYEETCLLNQKFVMDPDKSVLDVISGEGKRLGGELSLLRFFRFEVGEGVEKESDNFADDVARQARGD
jgi:elongation factor Ts